MVLDVLLPVLRLIALTVGGFLLFRIRLLQRRVLKPLVWLTTNIALPFYFIHMLPTRWADGAETGWVWSVIFFAAYLVFLGLQIAMGKLLINRVPLLRSEHPRELLVIFAMHNTTYIPLPILAVVAPPVVSLYLSFYVMAFMICVWTVTPAMLRGGAGGRLRGLLNGPTIGIALGLAVAVTGLYGELPAWATAPFRVSARFALDLIMVVLGGILAAIPAESLRFRREFGGYVLVKMVLWPALVIGILLLIPLGAIEPAVASGIKLAMVLEAVVPPATNIVVIARAYGTDAQVEYTGSAIIITYIAAAGLIPLFLVVSRLIFG